jgi:hypothetical protein
MAKMRPEAERRLRAGFQRRVDKQRERYAPQLAHAAQLAARFECGQVAGVFSRQADFKARALLPALLPLAAVPVLIVGAAEQVPGALPALGAFPFLFGAWYGVSLWRGMRQRVWFYAFTEGFMLPEDDVLVRWDQVTGVGPVWTEVRNPASEEPRTVLGGTGCVPRTGGPMRSPVPSRTWKTPTGRWGSCSAAWLPPRSARPCRRFPPRTRSSPHMRGSQTRDRPE